MKYFTIVCSSIAVFLCVTTQAQTNKNTLRQMANPGDTVWVFVNHVKADKKEQFEKFVSGIFWPMAKKLSEQDQRVFRQTRVLYPARPEPDGTYSYFFIMDPVVDGGDYDIGHLLEKMYGAEKAKEYMQIFDETAAAEQTGYTLVQSKY